MSKPPCSPNAAAIREAEAVLDPAAIVRLEAVGGASFVDKMLAVFLESVAGWLTALEDGRRRGDLATVARVAHSLRSSAAHVGASTLGDLARRLEVEAAEGLDGLDPLADEFADELRRTEAAVARTRRGLSG